MMIQCKNNIIHENRADSGRFLTINCSKISTSFHFYQLIIIKYVAIKITYTSVYLILTS